MNQTIPPQSNFGKKIERRLENARIDRKEIQKKLQKIEKNFRQVNFLVPPKLYKKFQKACAPIAASKIVAELMLQFIGDESNYDDEDYF